MVRRLRVGELQLDFCAVFHIMLYLRVLMFTVHYWVSPVISPSKFQTSPVLWVNFSHLLLEQTLLIFHKINLAGNL